MHLPINGFRSIYRSGAAGRVHHFASGADIWRAFLIVGGPDLYSCSTRDDDGIAQERHRRVQWYSRVILKCNDENIYMKVSRVSDYGVGVVVV